MQRPRIVTAAGAITRRGQRNDVVIDESAGVVRRYPRTPAALAELELSAARAAAAHARGLPAPVVIDVVAGPLGTAHLVLPLVGGVGLSPAVTGALAPGGRERLVADLVGLLGAMRSLDAQGWPGDPILWSERWATLGGRLRREVVPLIGNHPGSHLAAGQIAGAEEAADAAGNLGLTHGDLGGENLHVDPGTGALLGVLDWDDAAPGDPAVDLAALRVHAEPWLADALLIADPSLRELVARAEAYVGTFALQQALWGLDTGDVKEVDEGLATYRCVSSSPTVTPSTSSPSASNADRTTEKASPEE